MWHRTFSLNRFVCPSIYLVSFHGNVFQPTGPIKYQFNFLFKIQISHRLGDVSPPPSSTKHLLWQSMGKLYRDATPQTKGWYLRLSSVKLYDSPLFVLTEKCRLLSFMCFTKNISYVLVTSCNLLSPKGNIHWKSLRSKFNLN